MDQWELPHLGQLRQLLRIEPVALAPHVPPPPSIVGDVGHLRFEPKSTCQIAQPAHQRAYLKDDTVGLEVNEQRCAELLDASLMTITALAPEIGYDKCAALAKQAHQEGKTIKQLVGELKLMSDDRLNELMDYDRMTRPTAD